ncbi:SDR family NAD(P)-dependent oxidoreductase [Streptomyces sp. NRRL S-1868]|uniref:SDR family NAD(P)-dependent oxidoreductase n=1 Tax=Streptomyces sp. NRRL S-1868 TaxID=1463892 RepID=UPI0004C6C4FC|nr:SDR family oxidoreductase [Streptomyces sp. NRRL S-1868]
MQYAGTTALVTGASSGIGAEFARRLAGRGADVVLVGRREEALRALAADITAQTGRAAHPVVFDLGDERGGWLLKQRLDGLGIRVDTVINSAGMGATKPFAESTAAEARAQLQIDATAVMEVSQAFLPDLLASGRGALVNVGSLTGFMPVPGMAVYAASKAFVIRFTEALAYELREESLTVMVVSPGPTRTEFYERSETSTSGVRFQTPEQVVATALTALDRRRPPANIVSGRANRLMRHLATWLPTRTTLKLAQTQRAN